MEKESIDPWGGKAITDYEHVFKEFGLARFPEKISEKLNHRFFERKIVVAQRDFEKVFARIGQKKPFINITGIASSGNYHFGHKVDIDLFMFFKSLGARNYFSVSDIDAYCSRDDSKIPSLKKAKEFAVSNVQDLLAMGLNEKDLYVQSRKENRYFEFAFEASKKITRNTFEAVMAILIWEKFPQTSCSMQTFCIPSLKSLREKCHPLPESVWTRTPTRGSRGTSQNALHIPLNCLRLFTSSTRAV